MRRLFPLVLLGLTLPAQAQAPLERLAYLQIVLHVYVVLAPCVLGWVIMAAALAPERAARAQRVLRERPVVCWGLGLLQVVATLLLLRGVPPLGLLLLLALMGQGTLGLAAFLADLGESVAQLAGRRWAPLVRIAAGGAVLTLAGGLPYVGWLLLLMTAFMCAGSAVLGQFSSAAPAPDPED